MINLNREAFFATLETAAKVNLHVAGHLNPIVSATEASKAGLKAMEHLGPSQYTRRLLDSRSNDSQELDNTRLPFHACGPPESR